MTLEQNNVSWSVSGQLILEIYVTGCVFLPLSVDLLNAMNFAPTSPEVDFLASANASRLPCVVKVSSGIL